MRLLIAMMISYVIGSIPTAYIYGRLYKGIDIRQHGSGNVGATNVFRVLGKGPGITVLLIDIVKGIIPVVFIADVFHLHSYFNFVLLSVCVIIGHNWTVFLQFKGGKGVATSLGALIGLTLKIASIRPVLVMTIIAWIICFLISKIVSFSSILAAIFLPIFMVLTQQSFELVFLGIIFCLFVVIRHRPNIKRLLSGQEPRVILFKKK